MKSLLSILILQPICIEHLLFLFLYTSTTLIFASKTDAEMTRKKQASAVINIIPPTPLDEERRPLLDGRTQSGLYSVREGEHDEVDQGVEHKHYNLAGLSQTDFWVLVGVSDAPLGADKLIL
jgi:hypothetical protein